MAKSNKYKHPTCTDCKVPVQLFYTESSETKVDLVDLLRDPDTVEDSFGVTDVHFRCPDCYEPVQLTKNQLADFIKWGDKNLGEILWRTWDRHIKPFLEHSYKTSD